MEYISVLRILSIGLPYFSWAAFVLGGQIETKTKASAC